MPAALVRNDMAEDSLSAQNARRPNVADAVEETGMSLNTPAAQVYCSISNHALSKEGINGDNQRHDSAPKHSDYANPGPIGLLGFGITTVLLNLHNTGHFELMTVVVGSGIAFGGGAQILAGLLEFIRGNSFACTAFICYGSFWLSTVGLWMLPNTSTDSTQIVHRTSPQFNGAYLLLWGLFSTVMTACSLRLNVAMISTLVTVTLLFFLLAIADFSGSETLLKVAGYEGIVCGAVAMYTAFATLLNESWECTVLPVIPFDAVAIWRSRNTHED